MLNWLLVFVPVAIALEHAVPDRPLWIFVASGLAILPLAGWMGHATEQLAARMGEGIGGLLNATFGNAAELIIALAAMWKARESVQKMEEMYDLVHASLTGSIIGNILLVLGLSIVAGGLFHKKQFFNRTNASMGATLLALASIGLLVPAFYFYIAQAGTNAEEQRKLVFLSEEICVILAITYAEGSRTGGLQPWVGMGSAKAALESLVRYLAVAVAKRGITVNAISPGWTEDSVLNT